MTRWTLRAIGALAVTLGTSAAWAQPAAQTGTVAGQVIAAANRTPLVGAQVGVAGTPLGAVAANEGRFTLRNVPAGARTLHVQLIGYSPVDLPVTVTAGRVTTVTVEMKDVP